jgi:hypothetical protein
MALKPDKGKSPNPTPLMMANSQTYMQQTYLGSFDQSEISGLDDL